MKVCLINNLYKPFARGGAERVVENIVNVLKADGYEVFVITTKPIFKKVKNRDVKVYYFFPLNLFWIGNIEKHNILCRLFWHFFDIFNLHSYFRIKKILQEENPDLVITHNLKGIGYLIPKAINSLGIKYFHTLHDIQLAIPSGVLIKGEENNWKNKFFLIKLYQKINKKLFSYPKIIISPSKWLLDFYSKKGFFQKSKKIVLKNPLYKSQIQNHKLQINSIPRFDAGQNSKFVFMYVGQIEKHKGILFLIKVFKRLSEQIKNIDFRLTIIGGGSESQKIKQISKDNFKIIFLGKLHHKELNNFFVQSNCLIVPSLCYENSPTVIYESLSFGVPVLAADIGGIAELIQDNKNGYIFKAGDENDLLQKMEFCLKNKKKIKNMGELSKESIFHYNTQNYINKIMDL
ncbi:MAG: glycosyltransferase [Xanthomonadaceae bacterium]|nr:glycosyltransferase [Rhodospirillaceae bacterium]NIA17921.1 glycosyltransferase [Xanthomonadaceae bacterium]